MIWTLSETQSELIIIWTDKLNYTYYLLITSCYWVKNHPYHFDLKYSELFFSNFFFDFFKKKLRVEIFSN